MSSESKTAKPAAADRGGFLKMVGIGGVAGGIAAATGAATAGAAPAETAQTEGGYRETAHVRTYYDLAKF